MRLREYRDIRESLEHASFSERKNLADIRDIKESHKHASFDKRKNLADRAKAAWFVVKDVTAVVVVGKADNGRCEKPVSAT